MSLNITQLRTRMLAEQQLLASPARLELDAGWLKRLEDERQLWTREVRECICPYFPTGRVCVADLREVPPVKPGTLTWQGTAEAGPCLGLFLHIEIGIGGGAEPALWMNLTAAGRASDAGWSLAGAFPTLAGTLFAEVLFTPTTEPKLPRLTLASAASASFTGLSFKGLLDLDSLRGNARLLLGSAARGQLLPVEGTVLAGRDPERPPATVWPSIVLVGSVPADTESTFGDLARLEQAHFTIAALPRFNAALMRWTIEAKLLWEAVIVLGGNHRIPIVIEGDPHGGRVRALSRLEDALTLSFAQLAALFPRCEIRVPSDVALSGSVKLTQLELAINPDGPELVESIRLVVEASDENRWKLVDGLVTLDAIELSFLVRRPLSSSPEVVLDLAGLVGVGNDGVLRLNTRFSTADRGLVFSGGLIDDSRINLTQIFAYFRGGELGANVPELAIEDVRFSVTPSTGDFSGGIQLYGSWPVSGVSNFALAGVSFAFERKREVTSFTSFGSLELSQTRFFLAADYKGAGSQGWTFEGGTEPGSSIRVDELMTDVATLLGVPQRAAPQLLQGSTLSDLYARVDTATVDCSFRGRAALQLDGSPTRPAAALMLELDVRHILDRREFSFGGTLELGSRSFALKFDETGGTELWVASYANASGDKVKLAELVSQLSSSLQVPADLSVELNRAQLAIAGSNPRRYFFAIELGGGIDLSSLPRVGSYFAAGTQLSLVIELLLISADFGKAELERINALSPALTSRREARDVRLTDGQVQLRTALRVGTKQFPVSMPLRWDSGSTSTNTVPIATTQDASLVQWFPVQQAFGALHVDRVGVGLSASRDGIALLFDASLSLGGLTLSFMGLAAECTLAALSQGDLTPDFRLDGIGVQFTDNDLTMAGALLRRRQGGHEVYEGAVQIGYGQLQILGLGAWTDEGGPSLFLYALLDYPFGGPTFFRVEGLAFGFGYNRALKIPALEQLKSFPLIALARTPEPGLTPAVALTRLQDAILPKEGQYFIAAGVKFNSFKIVDGFVLVSVAFGRKLEFDLAGIATLASPPAAEAAGRSCLMKAELALRASYRPDEGVLEVRGGLLPDAYLFSPNCHLSGGFAFASWFKDKGTAKAGDFVLTLGGYHPKFTPEAHYPRVPRLALSWQVTEDLSIKANAYFAVTPGAIMTGGQLRVNWQSGDLHAWFDASVDCLVQWQPYHYSADLFVSIGVEYRTWCHTFSADLTAQLEVWGPEFSGKAHVNWWVCSFDIEFGPTLRKDPELPSWEAFQSTFLPTSEQLLTLSAAAGKTAPQGKRTDGAGSGNTPLTKSNEHLGLLNPRQLCIRLDSAVPLTNGTVPGLSTGAWKAVGVKPRKQAALNARFSISIVHASGDVTNKFEFEAVQSALPAALWGTSERDEQLVSALTGILIRPAPIPPAEGSVAVASQAARLKRPLPAPKVARSYAAQSQVNMSWAEDLNTPEVRGARLAALRGLLPSPSQATSVTVRALLSEPRQVE